MSARPHAAPVIMRMSMAALLAWLGCGAAALGQHAVSPTALVSGLSALPANYRQLAVAALGAMLKDKIAAGFAQGSPPRAAVAPQPGDWMMCLRTTAEGAPMYLALFFAGGRADTLRRAVAIDRCGTASYEPLPAAAGAGRPGKRAARPSRK